MQIKDINLDSGLKKTVLAAGCIVLTALNVLFMKWAFGHAIAVNANEAEVATIGVDFAPNDAFAHFNFARLLEKTLLPEDQSRALHEYEMATALSPNNYEFWLSLGHAREQSGDPAGAEQAFRKAQSLAPNYSRVAWALGNALLRQDRQDEAFAEMRKAVAADPTFANPAASAAWQAFGGDVARIRQAIGDSPRINGSLAVLLAADGRYAEALNFWRSVAQADKQDEMKETGQALYNKLIEGRRYRSAIQVATETGLFSNDQVGVGTISNGGFESSLATQDANAFSWVIAEGTFPRVGLNESQKHGGNYSLLMNFGQGGKGFRQVSQKVGVEPGAAYDLRFFYHSELTTEAKLRCNIVSVADGSLIAGASLSAKQEWGETQIPFTVPTGVEGIEIRIAMENCSPPGCMAAGNIWFDDFSLSKR